MKGRLAFARHLLFSIPLAILFFMLLGCAANKPSISIIDENYNPPRVSETDRNFLEAKSILAEISKQNPLLAIELGKLPELQDEISTQETRALDTLQRIHLDDNNSFDMAFDEMYKIGKPEVRKYCSPLQALFWLAEDNKLRRNSNLLVNYSLRDLLAEAWKFDNFASLSEDQLTEILNDIKSRKKREDYLARSKRLTTGSLQAVIIAAYKEDKYAFTREARNMIEASLDPRWEDFEVVTDRLNAPELIDYYEKKSFTYQSCRGSGLITRGVPYLFKNKMGNCVAISKFTVHCLRRNGYKAQLFYVKSPTGAQAHVVTLAEINDQKYIIDNGRPGKLGIVPYDEYVRWILPPVSPPSWASRI